MLPDFIVIGAMKAGTTSLFRYLNLHPNIYMPWRKELDFFSNPAHWEKGVAWYEEQFAGASPGEIIGEASPNYTKAPPDHRYQEGSGHTWPETSKRMAETVPNAKLIYLIRDPIDRMESMHLDMLHYGGQYRTMANAINNPDYVMTSLYGLQLAPYVELFGADQILVETSERLRSDRTVVLDKVFSFLGVDPAAMPDPGPIEANRSDEKRIPNRLGMYIRRYRPWAVDPLREDLPAWRKRLLMRQSSRKAARLPKEDADLLRVRFTADLRLLQEMVDVDLSGWDWYQPQ